MSTIHPTAVVDSAAKIGADVSIGPGCVIAADVEIGDGCRLDAHVVIQRYTTLGPRCRIHPFAVLGDTPQDLAFRDTPSFVRIGADVTIREGVTIHRGTKEGTVTEVGDGCFLMANSHLAHNVRLGKRVILANAALLGGYAEVGDGAFISGNAAVHQFVRVGRLAMLGGLSVATKDVPPFCIVRTGSYNRLAGINVVGLRRAGVSPEDRAAARSAFRALFRTNRPFREALAEVEASRSGGPALEIVAFVRASKRGVCRATRSGEASEE